MRLNSIRTSDEDRPITTNGFEQAKEIILEEERKRKEAKNARKVRTWSDFRRFYDLQL